MVRNEVWTGPPECVEPECVEGDPLRIVIAGYHPADPSDIHGGVEAITLRLVEGLALLGEHELHVAATRSELRSPETKTYPGRTVHLLPRSPRLGNITLMWSDRRRLRSLFRELAPDIIHAHSTSEFALAALESGFPTVVSVHGIVQAEARLERGLIPNSHRKATRRASACSSCLPSD